ncbi:glycosyltransferase [Flexilinea flocculi]|jgi:glycosyltransferase involved in cell wall biosynthesis|uniref:Glycosyltransferase n=1 Tax=Flexilinea flocculi TaxID=1678840 RepID=A0A0K8P974_9CHLR|nr:glycosyltransferase [Flexilinea flocculi]GAP39198.1 glycosyltransferase [Flexilinea flocculi]
MQNEHRIIFFGSQITTGGAQRVLLDQASWFHAKGWRVLVIFYYDKDGKRSEWQAQYPFPIEVLSTYTRGGGAFKNLSGLLSGLLRLDKAIREFKPQAIECFTHDANLIGIPIAWLCGVPIRVGTHHGQFVNFSKLRSRLHTAIINSSMTTHFVCVSSRARKQALQEGIRDEKIRTIFNGVRPVVMDVSLRAETRADLGLQAEDKMVINVGRLVPEKAQRLLIDAAAIVRKYRSDVRFFIAGEGPLRDSLTRLIQKHGLEDVFCLLGNRSDIAALLNAADLFVLYSETEGMPVSLMEAMSVGLPVIASDLEGVAEIVNRPDVGTLIPFGDSSLLANQIIERLAQTQQSEKQGRNGQKRILEDFSLDRSCTQYQEMITASGVQASGS